MQSLRFSQLVSYRGMALKELLKLVSGLLPHIILFTMPIGFLLALLWCYNRIIIDKEKSSMSACGVSSWFFAWPAVALSFCLAGFLYSLSLYFAPKTVSSSKKCEYKLRYYLSPSFIVPSVFFQLGHKVLYVHKKKSPNFFEGVFIYDETKPGHKFIITGQQAYIAPAQQGIVIALENGTYQHISPLKSPSISVFKTHTTYLVPQDLPSREKHVHELSLNELRHPSQDNQDSYKNEWLQRLFLPILPLGIALWATWWLLKEKFQMIQSSIIVIFIALSFQVLLMLYTSYAIGLSCLYVGLPIFLWGLTSR